MMEFLEQVGPIFTVLDLMVPQDQREQIGRNLQKAERLGLISKRLMTPNEAKKFHQNVPRTARYSIYTKL